MLNSSIKEGNIIGKIFKGIVHSLTKKKKNSHKIQSFTHTYVLLKQNLEELSNCSFPVYSKQGLSRTKTTTTKKD